MLICYYLTEFKSVNVIYVALDKHLRRAVLDKMSKIKVYNFEVIEDAELWEYIDRKYVFVYDEYHAGLVNTKMELTDKGVNPIFHLGQTVPVIMVSGHKSKEFQTFMRKYFQ